MCEYVNLILCTYFNFPLCLHSIPMHWNFFLKIPFPVLALFIYLINSFLFLLHYFPSRPVENQSFVWFSLFISLLINNYLSCCFNYIFHGSKFASLQGNLLQTGFFLLRYFIFWYQYVSFGELFAKLFRDSRHCYILLEKLHIYTYYMPCLFPIAYIFHIM